MANENELVIKISGDVGDYKAALELASEQTGDLSEGLKKVAEAAAVAFAALSVEVYESVEAFHEHVTAVNELTLALQNQGMYSSELVDNYKAIADAIAEKTGIDKDAILSSMASGQALLGQVQITEKLTKAIVDFSVAQKLGLDEAFKIVAKSVNGQVNILQRYGISLDGAVTSTDKLAVITEKLTTKYNDWAEQSASASGSTVKLKEAFDEMQKAIGERLAPVFDVIVRGLEKFFNFVSQHAEVANFAGSVVLAGTAVAGLATAFTAGSIALLQLRAALIAAGLAAEATATGFRVLAGSTGIGLLIVAASEVYIHWNTIWPATQRVFLQFAGTVIETAKGIGTVLAGMFHHDPKQIKRGLNEVIDAYSEAKKTVDKIMLEGAQQYGPAAPAQDPAKAKAAKAEADLVKFYNDIAVQQEKAKNQLLKLEDEHASKDTIELKKQEIQLLTELENKKNGKLIGELQKRLAEVRKLEADQAIVEKQRNQELNDDLLKSSHAYQSMSLQEQKMFLERNAAALKADLITEHNAKEAWAKQELDLEKKNHNTFLIEQQHYGTAYATINKAMHSAVFNETNTAMGDLAALANSSNATLKAIGKEAATAQIIIKTAQSAMAVYSWAVDLIPPPFGEVAGLGFAAAVTAYGAEQVGAVQSAARGGLLEGGIPGVDSIPVLAMAGEVVAPRQNFEEVIGSVAASRAAKESGLAPGSGGGDPQTVALLSSINNKLDNQGAGAPQITIHGDALGDPVWLDQLVKKLGEALEFRHARIPGINVALA